MAQRRLAARLFTTDSRAHILRSMKRTLMGLAIVMAAVSLDALVVREPSIAGNRGRVERQQPAAPAPANDPIRTLVSRLDLEKYKATVKGLTQFGDRRQGTKRNRNAVDWIEAQLKSYGCANSSASPTNTTRHATRRWRRQGGGQKPLDPTIASGEVRSGPGGSRYRGITRRTGVNNDPMRQPDEKLRALNTRADHRRPARRTSICTKVGTTRPDEMYIVGAHMDGHGWGEAANDNGSGTALVMELARIFSMPDVQHRAHDPLRAVEQRRDRPQRRARLRRAARSVAGQGEPAGIRTLSRTEVARHDPARHDDVGSRHAARGRDVESRAAARGRREHRVPVDVQVRRRSDEAGVPFP